MKPRSVLCEVLPSIFFFCFWKNIINGKNYTLMWSYITNQHLPYNHVKYWDIRTHFEIQIFWHLNSSWRGRNHWKKRKTFAFVQRQKKREKKRRKHSANWPVSKSSHHISQTKSFSSRTLPVNYSTEPFFFSTMECFVYSVDARNILKMTLVFSNYISSGYTLPHQRQGMLWTLA